MTVKTSNPKKIKKRCPHEKIKYQCKMCKGSQICKHIKRRSLCKICGGSSLCKSKWCEIKGISKYNGYCLTCCIQLFPDIKVHRNYKTKERFVVDKIKEQFSELSWIEDKKIQDGCSYRRPDLLLDLGTHILIVEIDENKHSVYNCLCENKRIMEISKDVNHRPIVFIRFNPDSYTNIFGEIVKSCWKLNKIGVMVIVNNKEMENRIACLLDQIKYWIDNCSCKTVEIIELFY